MEYKDHGNYPKDWVNGDARTYFLHHVQQMMIELAFQQANFDQSV
jgi:hypothetical protein